MKYAPKWLIWGCLGLATGAALAYFPKMESPVPNCRPPGNAGDFGPRIHPVTGASDFHNGVDLKAAVGEPYKAPADGEIIEIVPTDEGACGVKLTIKHDDGFTTTTCHLKEGSMGDLAVGTKVEKGQKLAEVGQTGRCTGPHSHLVIRDPEGNLVDPTLVIQPLCPEFEAQMAGQSSGSSSGRARSQDGVQ